jgi:hypothetical protein
MSPEPQDRLKERQRMLTITNRYLTSNETSLRAPSPGVDSQHRKAKRPRRTVMYLDA